MADRHRYTISPEGVRRIWELVYATIAHDGGELAEVFPRVARAYARLDDALRTGELLSPPPGVLSPERSSMAYTVEGGLTIDVERLDGG